MPVLQIWIYMPHTLPLEQQMRIRWDRLQPTPPLDALSCILHMCMQQYFCCQADHLCLVTHLCVPNG